TLKLLNLNRDYFTSAGTIVVSFAVVSIFMAASVLSLIQAWRILSSLRAESSFDIPVSASLLQAAKIAANASTANSFFILVGFKFCVCKGSRGSGMGKCFV